MEVFPADGGDGVTITQNVPVQDWLIVAFGDSYGSGEGAPDKASSLCALAPDANSSCDVDFARGVGAAWQQFTAYLEGVGNDCGVLASTALLELGETLVESGIDGFLASIGEKAESVQRCAEGFVGIGDAVAELALEATFGALAEGVAPGEREEVRCRRTAASWHSIWRMRPLTSSSSLTCWSNCGRRPRGP